ncbi:apolipoprotein D-like [Belonocnema kinseyi]|uniref:apolipoprotein D-like n=1 Tax=Belonocnema kinseyi TaxID=2817044 RepID=UPI00143DCBB1|nr:apolipoprotein D-like [Belonocnema kinseyi]
MRVWLFDALVWTVLYYGVKIWGWKAKSMYDRFRRKTIKNTVSGTATQVCKDCDEAELSVALEIAPAQTFSIFYIDYKRFIGVYSCVGKRLGAWILARKEQVDDEDLEPVFKSMEKNGLNPKSLTLTDREGCI